MKFDPLDFDPSQFGFNANDPTPTTPAPSSIPASADGEAASAAGPDTSNEPAPLAAPAENRSLVVRLGPMPSGASRPHHVSEQLAMVVSSLEVTDMPLSRFVETLSDMANVPIALDPAAFELAGVSTRQPLSIKSKDVAIEKLLRLALAKHRLGFVEADRTVTVTLADGDKRRAAEYDVQDLVGDGDGKRLIGLIERFVAPAMWQSAGGTGTIQIVGTKLRIDHIQSVRNETLIFCERLRMARGRPVRSRYPVALLSIDSPYAKLAPILQQRATFTFLPWTSLADVLRHWQEASGLTILVDWSALADAELSPSSPISCAAIDRTWEEALDGILGPLGLGWWAVNGDTIQITSHAALDAIQRVEFYAVPKPLREQFADTATLIASLQEQLQQAAAESRTRSGEVRLELDEPAGRLIVLDTPWAHRQLSQRFAHE
jgi:hypothetical protein